MNEEKRIILNLLIDYVLADFCMEWNKKKEFEEEINKKMNKKINIEEANFLIDKILEEEYGVIYI